MAHRPTTAFVFSGGASLGAIQVGMLRALYEHGIIADMLVGTSVGAINAAFIASRPPTPATARKLERVWRGVSRGDVFPLSPFTMVSGMLGQRDHFVPARGLRQLIRRHVELEQLADAAIPLYVVAFDINSGAEVLLTDGPAAESIAAACAIPGVFPPVAMDGRLLVDGGVINNTPISHAVELGAERIYVLATQVLPHALRSAPQRALDATMYALGLLVGSRLQADIQRYENEVELIVLPTPNATPNDPTDFEHSQQLIGDAYAASRDLLAGRLPTLAAARRSSVRRNHFASAERARRAHAPSRRASSRR